MAFSFASRDHFSEVNSITLLIAVMAMQITTVTLVPVE